MNASAIQSAAHAGRAWLATAAAHAITGSVPALNLKQFLAVLALAFGMGILDWLDRNPLPAGEGVKMAGDVKADGDRLSPPRTSA